MKNLIEDESELTQKIHKGFKKLSFNDIKKEIDKKSYFNNSLRCIIPYLYKKDINSETKIYGAAGNIYIGNDDHFYLYPAREFPSGKINPYGEIRYEYTSYNMPLLYSVDNLNLGYQLALAAGGLINMVDPFEKMTYIYNLMKNEENEDNKN
ncbi:MAG: hypothetical protein [Wendovervirus sonii]|uniref:Uncharacterized protein n=1 Tax=phage Lak_Megaphage_Sonny TaxID=3109229 RepID=A0ABZ0Z2R4_9CAUD|nr:MAG: hypothetical protein [phage Lak_Megaphage_Sonny]